MHGSNWAIWQLSADNDVGAPTRSNSNTRPMNMTMFEPVFMAENVKGEVRRREWGGCLLYRRVIKCLRVMFNQNEGKKWLRY